MSSKQTLQTFFLNRNFNFSQDVRHVLLASDCAQQHGLGPADQHVPPAQDSCHRKHWKWVQRGKQNFFVKQIALVLGNGCFSFGFYDKIWTHSISPYFILYY